MTLQNFIKTHTLKKRGAPKLIVRDLDEIEKNNFVAYVDENDMSYDVKLTLDTELNVVENTCDCEHIGVCQHLVALANHLKENKKEKVVVKTVRKKKLTEIEQLIDAQDPEEVFLWLKTILNKNKEWALVFKQNFSSKNIELSEENINNTIQECFVSVVGRRKKLESNELKKIIDAIELSLKPFLSTIYSHINVQHYQYFLYIVAVLYNYEQTYKHKSARLTTFIEKIKDNYFIHFFNSKDTENWQQILKTEIDKIFLEKINHIDYQIFLKIYKLSKEDLLRNQFIAKLFNNHLNSIYSKIKTDYFPFNQAIEQLIFEVINDNQLFENHYTKFKPQTYNFDYNISLIEALINIEQYQIAQEFCKEQINNNYKEEFYAPYYKLLAQVYKKSSQLDALTDLYLKIGRFIYDYEIYQHLKQYAVESDFQKFYYSVLPKIKDAAKFGNRLAFDFFYQVQKEKNKEKDIIKLFSKITNLDLITDYVEIASNLDATAFIKNLFETEIYIYNNSEEKLERLISKIIEVVPINIIKNELNVYKSYWANAIYKSLKQSIQKDL